MSETHVNQSLEARKAAEEIALTRYQWISPLLDEELTPAERGALRRKIAVREEVSERTMYRYEELYKEKGFRGLFPSYEGRSVGKFPENYDDLIREIITLRLENPSRSIDRCIFILETEGTAPRGLLKRSTVQDRLQKQGYSARQIRKQEELRGDTVSSGRHQQPHRMMMLQADYKDGPKIPAGTNGRKVETHLLVIIDDCTRYVVHSAFYLNEKEENVETGLRDVLTRYGLFLRYYTDNGACFISKNLRASLNHVGIPHTRSRPHRPKGRGKVEKFNRMADVFISEVSLDRPRTLEELNEKWKLYMEAYYQEKPHEELPGKISPRTAWDTDSRPLRYVDRELLAEAFLRRENRIVDNSGCISFKNCKYEVGLPLVSQKVEVVYDPLYLDEVEIRYGEMTPFKARKLEIGEWVHHPKEPEKPDPGVHADYSRFLKALETKQGEIRKRQTTAISFRSYKKEGTDHV